MSTRLPSASEPAQPADDDTGPPAVSEEAAAPLPAGGVPPAGHAGAQGEPEAAARAAAESSAGEKGMGSLQRRAVGGTSWTVFGYGVQNVIRLVGNIILTRLLFPEAFGLMQIINTFLQGLQLFTDLGLAPCIVQSERGEEGDFLDTAWTMGVVRGFGIYLVCLALTYPVYLFYGSEPLAFMLLYFLPVSGLRAVWGGFSSTKVHVHKRNLALREVTLLDIGTQVVGLVVMIVWAAVSPSIWALVVGGVVESFTRMVLSHLVLEGHRNRFRWDRDAARSIFHFGKWIFISTVVAFLAQQSDKLIFGKLIPWDLLGVYGIAASLYLLPVNILLKLAHTVIFPVLSRLRERGQDWVPALHQARRPLLFMSGAGVGCMLPAGPAIIDLLYDHRYADAGWMLQILLVGAFLRALEAPNVSVLLAVGRTGWIAVGHTARLAGLLVFLPVGFWLGGFPGALWGLVAADGLKYLVALLVVRQWGVRVLVGDLGLGVLLVASLAVGLAVAHVLPEALPLVARLLAVSAAGGALWLLPIGWWALSRWRAGLPFLSR